MKDVILQSLKPSGMLHCVDWYTLTDVLQRQDITRELHTLLITLTSLSISKYTYENYWNGGNINTKWRSGYFVHSQTHEYVGLCWGCFVNLEMILQWEGEMKFFTLQLCHTCLASSHFRVSTLCQAPLSPIPQLIHTWLHILGLTEPL